MRYLMLKMVKIIQLPKFYRIKNYTYKFNYIL